MALAIKKEKVYKCGSQGLADDIKVDAVPTHFFYRSVRNGGGD